MNTHQQQVDYCDLCKYDSLLSQAPCGYCSSLTLQLWHHHTNKSVPRVWPSELFHHLPESHHILAGFIFGLFLVQCLTSSHFFLKSNCLFLVERMPVCPLLPDATCSFCRLGSAFILLRTSYLEFMGCLVFELVTFWVFCTTAVLRFCFHATFGVISVS